MKSIWYSLLRAVVLFGIVPKGDAHAEVRIEEQVVAPPWKPGTVLTLSPKGMHFASTHPKGDKFVVVIDGVASAEYEQVLNVVPTIETTYYDTGFIMTQSINNQGPVAFSPDGSRHAYAVRMGTNVVVVLGGKEIFRAPHSQVAPPVALMQFTPDGKHLYFYSASGDTMQSFRLMMDGKPVTPAFDQTPQPVFSADGSRWMLNAGKAKQPMEKFLIIDGKDSGYPAERPLFTPDGTKVVCVSGGRGEQQLLLDGKSIMKVFAIDRYKVGASGDIAAIVQLQAADLKKHVYLNGKLVSGTEGALDVNFSPDGKRWAAKGMTGLGVAWWIVLDGKKHKDYKEVSSATFSPDSSICLYYGRDDAGTHAVNNGAESEAYAIVRGSTFARTGNKFAYAAGPNALHVYYDGKMSPPHKTIYNLELSPDGTRRAYYATVGPTVSEFIVDGEMMGYGGAFGGTLFFSADSKHIAAQARHTNGYDTIYIDGTFLPERLAVGTPREFTPDSRHLITVARGSDSNRLSVANYYVDGDQVAQFSSRNMYWVNSPKMIHQVHAPLPFGVNSKPPDPNDKEWEVQPDGSIIFIGSAPGPEGYGPITRIKVTPSPDKDFTTWVAGIPAAEAKAASEAAAARTKAAEEAAVAKKKADEEAAVAAAKRKADYDAAVATRNKARQDAINAQKLKVLNAQRAKQKLPPLMELPPSP